MSSIVDRDAAMRVLRASVPRIEKLTLEDTKDPKRIVRTINALIELVSKVAENDALPYVDFEDVAFTAGQTREFRHGFNGRVRVFPVAWSGAAAPGLSIVAADSDDNTVTVQSVGAGTATIRVQRSSW
jgi:hypothetical protein